MRISDWSSDVCSSHLPLASAVSNAGGLGIIETSSGETDNCIAEIAKMRDLTDRPFGINLPLLFLRDARMVDAVCNALVTFVSTSAGAPGKLLGPLKDAGQVVWHVVPTPRAALKAAAAGVDGQSGRAHVRNTDTNAALVDSL